MPSKTRTGLIALTTAVPIAAVALFSNAPAQGGQFLLSPAVLMAEAETTEREGMGGMMGQGGMGGMMDQGDMGQGGMGGMMDMMQQMSRMMDTCNEMMAAHGDHENGPADNGEPENQQ